MSLTGGDPAGRARAARRTLAVALVGCGVLGLQSLPTASAAKGSGGSTVTSASEGSSAAATRRAERAAAKAEAAAPAPSPAPPALESPKASGTEAGAGTAPHKGAAASAHAQRREERREARHSGSSTSSSTSPSTAASGSSAKPAVTSGGGDSSAESAETFARKQKKGTGGGQKGKKEHKGKKAQQEEEGPVAEGTGSEGASSPGAKPKGELAAAEVVAQASAASASLALPAAAPAADTAPPSVGSVTPIVTATPNRSGVNADKAAKRRAARRARRRSSATGAAAASSAAPLLAAQASAAAPAARAKRTAVKHSPQSSQPALVKTFTKIVGVVPTPVRFLIGGLILLALMLAVRSLLSGVRTRRLVRQRGQLLEDVGLLQAALLPEPPARLGPVATSAAYRPADGPGAGGDFYDVFALEDGEIAVIVGDVSGHGREALPHTALVRFTVRAYLEAGLSPRKALQTAGNVLDRQLADSFATVVAATYNPRERKLTYASAGHPPPVMLGEQGDGALALVTSCSAPPIGAGMPTGTRQTVVSVPGPTRLCFHTDGVTEARIDGQLFGAGRLGDALSELDREADASALLDRVAELSDARPDDMAACLLRVHDGHGAPAIALEQLELSRELLPGGRVERFLLDCGVEPGRAASIADDARRRLQRTDRVMLELVPGAGGPPVVSLIDDNVIRAAALATAGASQVAVTR